MSTQQGNFDRTNTVEISPRDVGALLVGEAWVNVRNVAPVGTTGFLPLKSALGFETDQGWEYVSIDAIYGVRTRKRILSEAEAAEARAESVYQSDRLFEHQHYASRDVYNAAVAAQLGRCPGPKCQGAELTAYPITHYTASDGIVRCQLDSDLKPRIGQPV
jgi:hypothetical protein